MVKYYDGFGNLPHFNDAAEVPDLVNDWRNQITEANAGLFCTPGYAFGVPGTLKNALDWAVGSVVFSNKSVSLISSSSGGEKAHAGLQHILTALGTSIIDTLLVSFVRTKLW